jgi:hypothetical protein
MSTLLLVEPRTVAPPDVLLLHAFARRGRPLCVSELVRAMTGTGLRLSDLMAGLADELAAGRLAPRPFRRDEDGRPTGALTYELTGEGWEAVLADRVAA